MSAFAKIAFAARDGWVNGHAFPVFCNSGKFVTQHQRTLKLRIPDPGFCKPVYIGAANPNCFYIYQFFPFTRDGDRFIVYA
jgi:hypothetical protein